MSTKGIVKPWNSYPKENIDGQEESWLGLPGKIFIYLLNLATLLGTEL